MKQEFLRKQFLFLKYFLPLLAILFLIAAIWAYQEQKNERLKIAAEAYENSTVLQWTLKERLKSAIEDIKTFIPSPEFIEFLDSKDEATRKKLSEDFSRYCEAKIDSIFQLRYIDETGMEVIRIDTDHGVVREMVNKNEFQNKAERYFFKETMILPENQIYISAFDLNVENGKLSIPYIPTIRFAIPVFDKNKKRRGIIIANLLGNYFINLIPILEAGSSFDFLVLDQDGYFIKGYSEAQEWGSMLPDRQRFNFNSFFPEVWPYIFKKKAGHVEIGSGLLIFNTVKLSRRFHDTLYEELGIRRVFEHGKQSIEAEKAIIHVVSVPNSVIFARIKNRLYRLIIPFIGLSLVFAIISFSMANFTRSKEMAEASLKEREELFDLIARSVSEVIWITESGVKPFKIIYASPAYEYVWGRSLNSLYKNPETFFDSIHPDDTQSVQNAMQLKLVGKPYVLNYRIVLPNGAYRWIWSRGFPCSSIEGEFIGKYVGISADTTELQHARERLLQQYTILKDQFEKQKMDLDDMELKFSIVFDTLSDGVFLINNDGKIATFNNAAEQIFGYLRFEIIDKNISVLIPEFDVNFEECIRKYMVDRSKKSCCSDREGLALNIDGKSFPIHLDMAKIDFAEKPMYVGIVRDISDLKKNVEELKEARFAAESASRAKSLFISNISHELRTPMNAILGFARLLSDSSNLSADQMDHLKAITEGGNSLLALLNDILDISKLESGHASISHVVFNPRILIEELRLIFFAAASEKNLEFSILIDEDLPAYIFADMNKIKKVLANLLDNSVKFTETGYIIFKIRVEKLNEQIGNGYKEVYLLFDIEDTGRGINEAEFSRLFDTFYQVEEVTTMGLGLGLALIRGYVHLMGGSLSLKSQIGRGSCFTLKIPVGLPDCHKLDVAYTSVDKEIEIDKGKVDQAKIPDLSSLDSEIVDQMMIAVENGDVAEMVDLCDLIEKRNSAIGSRLRKLVENFEYEKLNNLLMRVKKDVS